MARGGSSKGRSRDKTRAKRPIQVRAAPDGSDLCLQCGLCCDGVIFNMIPINDDERGAVEALGLVVESDDDGKAIAPQPCPAFIEGSCSLYEVGRPAICSTYACALLRSFNSGSATIDDTLPVIQLVWSVVRELEIEMGLPPGTYNRRLMDAYLFEHQPWVNPNQYPRLLVAFHRLNYLAKKYFGQKAEAAEVRAAEAGAQLAASASVRAD